MLIGFLLKAAGKVKELSITRARDREKIKELEQRLGRWPLRKRPPVPKSPLVVGKQRVAPYTRRTGRVAGYERGARFRAATKKLYTEYHDDIQKWATGSVGWQKVKGVHFQSPADAIAAGVLEGLHALRRYHPRYGPVQNFIRPAIKGGVLKHLAWERSHGMTGVRTLYDLLHRAATQEEMEEIALQFPKIGEIPETLTREPESLEEAFADAYALIQRDKILDALDEELKIKLKGHLKKLREKEKHRKTWKNVSLARRQIDTYRMKMVDNLSFREIAAKLGIVVAKVHKDFYVVAELVKQVREAADNQLVNLARKEMEKALSKTDMWTLIFRLNLDRLDDAVRHDFPEEYIDFILDLLAVAMTHLIEIKDDEEEGA